MRVGRSCCISFQWASLCAVCTALVGCDSTLPEPDPGHRILGKVAYTGTMIGKMSRPALEVVAFPEFPPMGPPRASVSFVPPTFPTPYELKHVPGGSYKIIAEIVDLDMIADAGADYVAPAGAYPNFCAVLFSPTPNVMILNDKPVENVDIVVYDSGNDPCFAAPPPRPDAGVADAALPDAPLAVPDARPVPDAAGGRTDAGADAHT